MLVGVAILLTIPRIIIRNYAWQLILKKQKINISFKNSLKIFLIGYFYASITPGYLGQLMRIPYLKEKTNEPTGKLFVNTFVETAIHTLSMYIMMVLGAFLISEQYPEATQYGLIFLTVILFIYAFFIKKERGEKFFNIVINFFIPKKLKKYCKKFVDTFYRDFPSIKDLILPFLVSAATWIIMYTQIYIIALSLNVNIPYFVFLLIYPIANIIAFIPITSAGLGTREATVMILFSFFNVSPEKAIVISLAGHLITDVLTGFYGLVISIVEARNNKKSSKRYMDPLALKEIDFK